MHQKARKQTERRGESLFAPSSMAGSFPIGGGARPWSSTRAALSIRS
ncbi:hypothetical protein A7982_12962 [Minicystis rosea]|nr:hypothetical protein A7982_12962 [Minicystis rosea]